MINVFRAVSQKCFKDSAYKVVLNTANHNRQLVAVNFNANLLAAIFEGSSFGLIFLALQILEDPETLKIFFGSRLFNFLGVQILLENMSIGQVFVCIIIAAITLQYLRNTLEYVGAVSSDYLSARIQAQMTERIFRHILSFSFNCSSQYKVGDLTSYINLAAPTVRNELFFWNMIIINVMTALAQLVLLLAISPLLSLITVVLSLGLFAIQKILIPKISKTAKAATNAQVAVVKHITESIQGLRVIHTFSSVKRTANRLNQLEQKLVPQLEAQARSLRLIAPFSRSMTLTSIGLILVLGFEVLQSQSAALLSSLITFLAVLNRLTTYLNQIINASGKIAQNSGDFNRLSEILSTADKEFVCSGSEQFGGLKEKIYFEDIFLRYKENEKLVLTNISFSINKGEVVALVGGSGAGKSSIADLLIGLYQPTKGQILIDGLNLAEYTIETWREHLGVVSQDTFIFNDSILENLRYGKPNASLQEIQDAAIAAQAHQFIEDLPDGYETIVGERGYRLSGGQRQRIALARALLKKPSIMILDEATSALDSNSEKLIQQAINQLKHDCTILVIAHRLSTITEADTILVLEQGKILEQGNHRALLNQEGHYYQYWLKQS